MDLENVNKQIVYGLSELSVMDTLVVINNTAHIRHIPKQIQEALDASCAAKRYVSIQSEAKQALDFCLCTYLGKLIQEDGTGAAYYIVSKDKGYDAAVAFARECGVQAHRIDSIQAAMEKDAKEQLIRNRIKELLPDASKKMIKVISQAMINTTSAQKYHNALQKSLYGADLIRVYTKTKDLASEMQQC